MPPDTSDTTAAMSTTHSEHLRLRPRSRLASVGQVSCGIEDGESGRNQSQDDQAAAEIGEAKAHLSQPNPCFDFLGLVSNDSHSVSRSKLLPGHREEFQDSNHFFRLA